MSKSWLVQNRGNLERVIAERIRVESGTLIFENGTLFEAELVCAVAPGQWDLIIPEPENDECSRGEHECDEEEE